MACGCSKKKPLPSVDSQAKQAGEPELRGPAHPNYTWPPRGNGPKPKTA